MAFPMKSEQTLVSVGLAVYNGETHLREALDSLLCQDHSKLEVIISDNASTDTTPEICLHYARVDSRVTYHRNDTNIGAARNFNRVFHLCSGNYFMWAAHDDHWQPTYISKCVTALDEHPEAVLCFSDITFVDESGTKIDHPGAFNKLDTRSMTLQERMAMVTATMGWYALYGVMRADALRATRLYTEVFGGDVILLMELLLRGESLILPEPLFSYRLIRKSSERYLEEITGSKSNGAVKSFTGLAAALAHVISEASCSSELKRAMLDDLVNNVSNRNEPFKNCIVDENPFLHGAPSYILSTEIRARLGTGIASQEVAELRESAFDRYASGLPLRAEARLRIRRWLDRYISWRFSASSSRKHS